MAIRAFAVSVTYRKQETAANTDSIPVSATNYFKFMHLPNFCARLALQATPKDVAKAGIQMEFAP
jgi:hypothetical protein